MTQEYQGATQKPLFRWVPGFIRHDLPRKIIALFFALLLYFMVTVRLGVEDKVSNVPVQIDLPADLVNLNKELPKVTVTIRGSKRKLKDINASSLKIQANVQEMLYTPGAPYLLRITPENVKAPFGVSVLNVEPRDITLNLDRKIPRKVPVVAKFDATDKLLPDYVVGKVKINPSEVWISGPESLVKEIETVYTNPIPLDKQVVDSFEYQAGLVAPEALRPAPDKVSVKVEIIKQYITRVIKSAPIRLLEAPEEKTRFNVELLSTPHVDVTINGPKKDVAMLKLSAIKPYIDVSGLEEEGSFSVDVNCWIANSAKITVTNIYPEKIKLKITRLKK